MVKKAFSKKFMLVVGILAALVILCSHAFQKETDHFLSGINKEKTAPTENKANPVIQAPNEAVTSVQAVETVDADASVILEILQDDGDDNSKTAVITTFLSDFFKTLFRVYISPQAP